MAKEYDKLIEQATVIRDEVEDGANTAIRVGEMFIDILDYNRQMENAIYSLDVNLSLNVNLMEYTASPKNVIVSYSIYRNGELVIPTTLKLTKDGELLSSSPVSSGSINVPINKIGETEFKLDVSYENISKSIVKDVIMVLPMYFGFSAATSADSLTITDLAKQAIKASPSGTYTLSNDTDGKYMWLCVPDTMGINRVTLNGFDVPMEGPQNKSTTLGTYKCYRNSNALIKGSYTIILS